MAQCWPLRWDGLKVRGTLLARGVPLAEFRDAMWRMTDVKVPAQPRRVVFVFVRLVGMRMREVDER